MTQQISASSMIQFFGCPASYGYSRKYQRVGIAQALVDGGDAHALMQGKAVKASPRAQAYAETFKKVAEDWEFTLHPEWQEVEQVFELRPGIMFKRIIDAIITLNDGVRVLVDWKTTSNLKYWPQITQAKIQAGFATVSPKAANFQAVSYLIPPPAEELERLGLDAWPTTIYFVVGTPEGEGHIYPYSLKDGDVDDFMGAARLMVGAINNNLLPRVKGDKCGVGGPMECPYLQVCYQVKGWDKFYTTKEIKDDTARD